MLYNIFQIQLHEVLVKHESIEPVGKFTVVRKLNLQVASRGESSTLHAAPRSEFRWCYHLQLFLN